MTLIATCRLNQISSIQTTKAATEIVPRDDGYLDSYTTVNNEDKWANRHSSHLSSSKQVVYLRGISRNWNKGMGRISQETRNRS